MDIQQLIRYEVEAERSENRAQAEMAKELRYCWQLLKDIVSDCEASEGDMRVSAAIDTATSYLDQIGTMWDPEKDNE